MYSIISYRCTTVIHNFKGYTSFILIKYWLYSLCYTIYPISYKGYFIHNSLQLLISPILPLHPSLSPLVTTSFSLYMCSLSICFLFVIFSSLLFQIPHISVIIQYLSVCLFSLSIISSKSFHVVGNGKMSFFFMVE